MLLAAQSRKPKRVKKTILTAETLVLNEGVALPIMLKNLCFDNLSINVQYMIQGI